MSKLSFYFLILILVLIPLYPKFPLVGVSGTFVSIRLEDFVIAIVATTWLITKVMSRKIEITPLHKSIILYLFIGFVSLFSAAFLTKTISLNLGLLHYFRRIEYLLFFFISFDFLKNKAQLEFAIRTFILVSFLVAIYGLGQQFFGFPVISTTNSEFAKGLALSLGEGARINSTFAGHYDLAAFSVFPLLLILGLLSQPVRHQWLLFVVGSLVYWTMLLSASRVTFAAFFFTAGLFVILIRKFYMLFLLAILAIISIIFTPQLLGRYQELIKNHLFSFVTPVHAQTNIAPVDTRVADALAPAVVPEDRSLNIRLKSEWPKALRAFQKNPILGTGFSSVGLAVDNDYLRLLAETGSLGFFAFLLIILRYFKSTMKYLLTPPQDIAHLFITATTLGFLGLMLNAVFIDVFEASKIAIVTWTLLGLSHKATQLR